jgi:hypothetical protein
MFGQEVCHEYLPSVHEIDDDNHEVDAADQAKRFNWQSIKRSRLRRIKPRAQCCFAMEADPFALER